TIRGLSSEEAHAEGRAQGMAAAFLPAYGPHRAGFRSEALLELDYPEHAHLRGRASANLVAFQRGALEALLDTLLPSLPARVQARIGKSVRFEVRFDRAVKRH